MFQVAQGVVVEGCLDCRYLIYNVKQQYAGLVLGWVTAKTKHSRVRVPSSLPLTYGLPMIYHLIPSELRS